MTLIEFVIFTASIFSLNTQGQQGDGLKYYWIRNDNFNFSLSLFNKCYNGTIIGHWGNGTLGQWVGLGCAPNATVLGSLKKFQHTLI